MTDNLASVRIRTWLDGAITNAQTTIDVRIGDGVKFASLATGEVFFLQEGANFEELTFVSRSVDTITVVRSGSPLAFGDEADVWVFNGYDLPNPVLGRLALQGEIYALESRITGFRGGIFPNGLGDATFVGVEQAATGTLSPVAPSSVSHLESLPRMNRLTAAAINAVAAVTQNTGTFWRGNAANLGGFTVTGYFGEGDLAMGTRRAVGMADDTYGTALLTLNNPSDRDNVLLVGWDDTDNPADEYIFFHNNTGVCVRVPTGIAPVVGNVYRATWHCDAFGSEVVFTLQNITSGGPVFSTTVSASIPGSTVFMTFNCFIHNGSSAFARRMNLVGMDFRRGPAV